MQPIFIGGAWPYANGSLHLGHIASLLSGDILARYYRRKGHPVLYFSGSDCYGTPIAVVAESRGVTPESIANQYHKEFSETFARLGFTYDLYSHTNRVEHHAVAQHLFTQLIEAGLLEKRTQKLPFCPTDNRFLPDRYVEGTCPLCGFVKARGDQCDQCGNLMDPTTLIDLKCKLDGTTPEIRETDHYFLLLSKTTTALASWVDQSKGWRLNALAFTREYLARGLQDRAVTRDTDWGVPIPIDGLESKRIYVWFEAVIGYLSASIIWAKERGTPDAWKEFWKEDALHFYVHGKDNIPFHSMIWPAMLMGASSYDGQKLHLPDRIVSSEYLTLEGKKLSTSRNWAVWIPDYLERFQVDSLRYMLTVNGAETKDADFTWDDFAARHNNELLATLGNLVQRTITFTIKNFGPNVPSTPITLPESQQLLTMLPLVFQEVGDAIEQTAFRAGLQRVIKLAQATNQYLDFTAPWKAVKTDPEKAKEAMHVSLQSIQALSILLDPFLPNTALRIRTMLKSPEPGWHFEPLSPGSDLGIPELLFTKIEPEHIAAEKARLGQQ